MAHRFWLLLATPALVTAACGRDIRLDARDLHAALPPAAARQPASDTTAPTQSLSTVLYSEREAELRARDDGVVAEVRVELGDRVRAGEVMARLRDESEAAAVAAARAAAELAHVEHQRAVQLREREMITQAELDQAVFKRKSADAALQGAEAQLEFTRIRAPFDGMVAHRFVHVGQAVKEGDALIRVTDPRPLRAQLLVPEQQARRLALGDRVQLRGVDGSSGAAAVSRIAPVVDPAGGTVELLLDVRQAGGLRPGSAVTVQLPEQVRGKK